MTKRKAEFLIALVSIAWGSSYIFMKMGISSMGAFNLVGWRFGVAFLVMLLLFYKKVIKVDKRTMLYSALLGLILCFVIAVIMISLKTTSTSSAGFLVGTTVVFVPLLQGIILKKMPEGRVILSVLFSIAGIAFLSITGDFRLEPLSLLCVLGALLYATQIIITSRFVRKVDSLPLGIWQLFFASVFGFVFSLIFEGSIVVPTAQSEWIAIVALAIICSAFGFVVQPIAQKYTTPEQTGILFAMEPVSAALLGFVFLNERIGIKGYIGAVLILTGVFVSTRVKKKDRS